MGSSIYTSGESGVMEQFHVSEIVATPGLTLFVLYVSRRILTTAIANCPRSGYGFGPMLWSSMSEIAQIGRKPTHVWTLAIFVMTQIPIALASKTEMLL